MGFRTLTMAEKEGKGWFAILLADKLSHQVTIPAYIRRAIMFAHGQFSRPLIVRVLQHRAACLNRTDPSAHACLSILEGAIDRFRAGQIDLPALKTAVAVAMPDDAIEAFLTEMA